MTARASENMCLRPIPATGSGWSTRAERDREREVDALRCLCGREECRDLELLEEREENRT